MQEFCQLLPDTLLFVKHDWLIGVDFYKPDNIHLTQEGNDMLAVALKDGLTSLLHITSEDNRLISGVVDTLYTNTCLLNIDFFLMNCDLKNLFNMLISDAVIAHYHESINLMNKATVHIVH